MSNSTQHTQKPAFQHCNKKFDSQHSVLYAECRFFIVILSDIALSIVILSVDKIRFFDEVSLCLKMSAELNKIPVACNVHNKLQSSHDDHHELACTLNVL
jgi:hypothetical protein